MKRAFTIAITLVIAMSAQAQDSNALMERVRIHDGSWGSSVAVDSMGVVYTGGGLGLQAFMYDGNSLQSIAAINDGGIAMDIAVGPDGTLFLANDDDGLRAYQFDGASFVNTAHVDDSNLGNFANGVAVGADGTIFLANGADGLRAYTYDGVSFTNTAHYQTMNDASDVAVGLDGTVFLADGQEGLRALDYDGAAFAETANVALQVAIGVTVSSDGTVFVAFEFGGLRAYNYTGTSFSLLAFVNDGGIAQNVAVGPAGDIVYLANWENGLRAYSFDGSSFESVAHIPHDTPSADVAVSQDGTLFLVNDSDGLFAYTYNIATGTDNEAWSVTAAPRLDQNFPNPFSEKTSINFALTIPEYVSLVIYDIQGRLVKSLVASSMGTGQHSVSWFGTNQAGEKVANGTYFYRLETGSHKLLGKMLFIQ